MNAAAAPGQSVWRTVADPPRPSMGQVSGHWVVEARVRDRVWGVSGMLWDRIVIAVIPDAR